MIREFRDLLFPDLVVDPGFETDLRKLARLSLKVVGGLEVAVPLLMAVSGLAVIPLPIGHPDAPLPTAAVVLVGVMTSLLAALRWTERYTRPIMVGSILLTAVALEATVLAARPEVEWIDHFLIGYITLVKLGSATLPFRPWQTLLLGIAVDVSYFVFWILASSSGGIGLGFRAGQHVFAVFTTLGCALLTGIIYRQRVFNFRAHQQARSAEARLLITENAADMGRLAAALSHELNSPIGALASAVDTLAAAALRCSGGSERVQRVVEQAHQAGRESADRLKGIVARMQRFTNLDRAEVQPVSVNELLSDVVALFEAEAKGSGAELNLQPVPRILARPQQLSAVFSNLLGNALDAGGAVRIATSAGTGVINIVVEDRGRGMTPEELENAFNPAWFHVSGSRVSAGYWSLFSCRQIIQEHGGDIAIESRQGEGTKVSIQLPAQQVHALE